MDRSAAAGRLTNLDGSPVAVEAARRGAGRLLWFAVLGIGTYLLLGIAGIRIIDTSAAQVDPGAFDAAWLAGLPSVVLPIALLARRPDAPWTLPVLLAGTLAVAAGAMLALVPTLATAASLQLPAGGGEPAPATAWDLAAQAFAIGVVANLTSLLGMVVLAFALQQRRTASHQRVPLALAGTVLAGAAAVSALTAWAFQEALAAPLGPLGVVAFLGLATYVATPFAVGLLAAVIVGGAASGEAPPAGWKVAALGGLLVLAGDALSVGTVVLAAASGQVVAGGGLAPPLLVGTGQFLLVIAVLLGLPSVTPRRVTTSRSATPP